MKVRTIFLSILFLACVTQIGHAQETITTQQWQSDLDYLQKKIHQDYPNLFYNISRNTLDSAMAKFRAEIPALTQREIYVGFARLMAMFRIGHTGLSFKLPAANGNTKPMFHYYPMSLYPFSDGLYIKSIHNKYKQAIGGKITKIGNLPVDAALEKMRNVIACENEQYFKSMLMYYLRLPEILSALNIAESADHIFLSYLKDGAEQRVKINADESPEDFWTSETQLPEGWIDSYREMGKSSAVLWLRHADKMRYYEYLPETKTLYVRHSAVLDEPEQTIEEFFTKVFEFVENNNVSKFVLDIRLNGGGNNYLNKSVITGIIGQRKINQFGNLFVMIGPKTFSAAQNLTNELEKYTEAIFIGEPTGENVNYWGDVKQETLPNSKLMVSLSWLWWQNMDPRDKRLYTGPDIAVRMSFANYRGGFDPLLKRVAEFNDHVPAHRQILDLAISGDKQRAIDIGKNYLADPEHEYVKTRLREKISDAGDLLMMRGKLQDASRTFEINTVLFPGSAAVHQAYAESMYFLGNIDDAVKHLKLAIQCDPNGEDGKKASETLSAILN
jgi:tetratricopeptide (TPR) repeat protein